MAGALSPQWQEILRFPQDDDRPRGAGHLMRRLYFFRASRRRSWGRAMTSRSLMPFMVSAATMALMTASSVACTVARKIWSRFLLGRVGSWWGPLAATGAG